MQCGIASLAMVASCWGKRVSLERLDGICQASKNGVSLLALTKAANELGFDAKAYSLTTEGLSGLELPLIVHWNQNHFVVLYRITKKHYYIADPAKGRYKLRRREFEEGWISTSSGKGVALCLTPTEAFEADSEVTSRKEVARFIMQFVRRYKGPMLHVLVGMLVGCALQLVLPFLTQAIVDKGVANKDIGFIWLILAGELMVVAGSTAIGLIRRWLLLHISMRLNLSLVDNFFRKLFKLPMAFFDTRHIGDLLQRIGDHGRVQSFLTNQLLSSIFSVVSFVVLGAVLFFYNRLIFLVFIIASIAYCAWVVSFLAKRKTLDYEVFEKQAASQNTTYQLVSLMQEIKLQNCETRRCREWEDNQADLFVAQMKSLQLQQNQESGGLFINEVKNILITVLSATAVINGDLTFGAMLAIQSIVGQMNAPISQIIGLIYSLQDLKISLDRISEVHNRESEYNESLSPVPADNAEGIKIENLTFRYVRHSPAPTLENININIPSGKVTAIVGASGSGKTTLLKLILGYYPVEEGRITINGRDLREIDLRQWRNCCGVVMQDGAVFTDTIEHNIAMKDDEPIDPDRLRQAATVSRIDEFIEPLPFKFGTIVGSGGRGLSQGQRQRLLLARAVYRNPGFIFLDEATNSLDAENEREVAENLSRVYAGKTVIIIAHRLSTVRNADQILVMDKGRIVETGNHEQLIAKRGKYFRLVKNQLELGA